MNDVDVAAIREALSKATPGPWATRNLWVATADAELIVLLRNNAEALLGRLERAEQIAHECWRECHAESVEVRAEMLNKEASA